MKHLLQLSTVGTEMTTAETGNNETSTDRVTELPSLTKTRSDTVSRHPPTSLDNRSIC